jgi:hypothetical protein
MFVGDRGTGVGSRIRGFRRYGGKWKETINSEAVNVCVTDENLTSQTCVFCFGRLQNPLVQQTRNGKSFMRKINDTLFCTNSLCISVIKKRACKSRDSLSALAIGLVGLSTVLFESTFPKFMLNKISDHDAEVYIQKTSSFLLQEKNGNHVVVLEVTVQ